MESRRYSAIPTGIYPNARTTKTILVQKVFGEFIKEFKK